MADVNRVEPTTQGTSYPRGRRTAITACLAGSGVVLVLVGVALLVVPNAAHVDVPNVGRDIFFDCGGAVYPGSRPAEEPGATVCADINRTMRGRGLALTCLGVLTTVIAARRFRRGAR